MKKFNRYLYEYENGQRIRNAGFVKAEEGWDEARIQVYGQGTVPGESSLEVFVCYLKDGQCIGVPMGQLPAADTSFGCRLAYSSRDLGGTENFRHTAGILLRGTRDGKTVWYGALWEEGRLRPEEMKPAGSLELEEEIPDEAAPEEENPDEAVSEEGNPDEAVPGEESQEEEDKEEETGPQTDETARAAEVLESQESIAAEDREEEKKETPQIYKISRQDLAGLPRREWKLANNQFLLHGFYNYHHLVSFYQEGVCWLGVPGIWHPKEQRAAAAFGFGRFIQPEEDGLNLEEGEREENPQFGYWCRQVSRVLGGEQE